MTDKITLELTLDELKALDKNLYYGEETWSIFDKIKYAYPQPKMILQQEGDYVVDYQAPNGDYIKSYPLINRVEVISGDGREFVRYDCSNVQISEQDNGRTLKVFLS